MAIQPYIQPTVLNTYTSFNVFIIRDDYNALSDI